LKNGLELLGVSAPERM